MDTKQLLGVFLAIVIALALTPAIIAETTRAQYGHLWTDTVDIDPSASNTTTLLHGPIWNNSAYMVLTLNGTVYTEAGAINYTVATIGSYSAGATLTWEGLDNTKVYNGTCVYRTLLSAMQVGLLALAPLFWVVLIIAFAVAVVMVEFRRRTYGR